MNSKLILQEFEGSPKIKERRMGRSWCPICGLNNCFKIDYNGWQPIFLCLKCSRNELFFEKIDFSKTIKCQKCGEVYIPIKSKTCPVCWVKYFKEEQKKNG